MKKAALTCIAAAAICAAVPAFADEGGVSFWLPGQMGSFAAAPGEPGWTLPLIYYHASTSIDGGKSLTHGSRVTVGLRADADLLFAMPTYTFATPVLGAQASLGAGAALGHLDASVGGTLAGPFGRTVGQGAENDTRTGGSDIYYTGSLKWNRDVHNFMVYGMGNVPVGAYTAGRLANLGINHYSLDAGGGYTYFNPKQGLELSAVLGFTYNWENKATQYKNGTDAHLDMAGSYFVGPQTHVGLVAYRYQQIGSDSGAGAVLGAHKSSVSGIGPQLGHFIPVDGKKWYLNVKAVSEFNAQNRADGWNFWITLAIPFGEEKK